MAHAARLDGSAMSSSHYHCFYCKTSETDKKLRQCTRCHFARYCSAECQKGDWPEHKKVCVAPSVPSSKQENQVDSAAPSKANTASMQKAIHLQDMQECKKALQLLKNGEEGEAILRIQQYVKSGSTKLVFCSQLIKILFQRDPTNESYIRTVAYPLISENFPDPDQYITLAINRAQKEAQRAVHNDAKTDPSSGAKIPNLGAEVDEIKKQTSTLQAALLVLRMGKIDTALKTVFCFTNQPAVRLAFLKDYAVALCKMNVNNLSIVLEKAPEISMGQDFRETLVDALADSNFFESREAVETLIAALLNWNNAKLLFLGKKDQNADFYNVPQELSLKLLTEIFMPEKKQ